MPGQPLSSLSINTSGALYTSVPAVTISLPQLDSEQAFGTLVLDQNGIITSATIVDSGGRYYNGTESITVSGIAFQGRISPEALAVYSDSNKIKEVQVFYGGNFFTSAPTVTIAGPYGDSATSAARGSATIENDHDGKVNVIVTTTLIDSGNYYLSAPTATVDFPSICPYHRFGNGALENLDSAWSQKMVTATAPVVTNDSTNSGYDINFWLWPSSLVNNTYDVGTSVVSGSRSIFYSVEAGGAAGTIKMGITDSSKITWATNGDSITSTGAIIYNDWNWIQMAHNGSTVRLTVNGDSNSANLGEATPASPVAVAGDTIFFGRDTNSALLPSFTKSFIGYIDNYRININDSNVGVPSNILPDSEYAGWDTNRNIIDYTFNKAAATVTPLWDSINYRINGFTITDVGKGYEVGDAPQITVSGQNIEPFRAKSTAAITNGQITSISITDSSSNYTANPVITISASTGDSTDFPLTDSAFNITSSITNGRISALNILSGGRFIDSAILNIALPAASKDNFRARALATIDSASGTVTAISLTDSGNFYTSSANVIIGAPLNTAAFEQGEEVSQTLSTGAVITGEVVKWSDSDNKLHLVHVGANDGKFHLFTPSATRPITGLLSGGQGVIIKTSEDNQISENEQNDDFSTIAADFLDFSEANPFGDPENN